MNIVSIHGRKSKGDKLRFVGSGLLLDSCHVLTAAHVWNDASDDPALPRFVGLLPGVGELLACELVDCHPKKFDACVLRIVDWEAPSGTAVPRLLDAYQHLNGQKIVLHAMTPSMPRVVELPLQVSAFDNVTREFELTTSIAEGNSGGAVVYGDVVVGLATRRVAGQPIARVLSLHALTPWIHAVVEARRACAVAAGAAAGPVQPSADAMYRASVRAGIGLSHRLGSIHLHVDGARARGYVQDLVGRHADFGAELSWVVEAGPGNQRQELKHVYETHDPDGLDFFSTSQLHAGPALPNLAQRLALALTVHETLCELKDQGDDATGVVVELERVAGTVDIDGRVKMSPEIAMRGTLASIEALPALQLFAPFDTRVVKPAGPAAYELHFSIDLPRAARADAPPLALQDLNAAARAAGVEAGGWFLFYDETRWAYRSNGFVRNVSALALESRWRRLRDELAKSGNPGLHEGFKLRLVAEEVLAVWRTPLMLRQDGLQTVQDLISWELGIPDRKDFWVLLPNFLGDQNDAMRLTMERNLGRGVRYTYFLSSNADAKRWLNFRRDLKTRLPQAERLMTAYVVAFAPDGPLAGCAAFIADPRGDAAEGYELTIDPSTNRLLFGSAMQPDRIAEIADALSPATTSSAITDWHLVQPGGADVMVTAVCVKLVDEVADDALDDLLDDLDDRLAPLASRHGGSVELYGGKSITVIFVGHRNELGLALQFVRQGMHAAERTEPSRCGPPCLLRVGIAFGAARLAVRASGPLWTGPAIRASHRVLERVERRRGVFVAAGADGKAPPFEPGSVELDALQPGVFELAQAVAGGAALVAT